MEPRIFFFLLCQTIRENAGVGWNLKLLFFFRWRTSCFWSCCSTDVRGCTRTAGLPGTGNNYWYEQLIWISLELILGRQVSFHCVTNNFLFDTNFLFFGRRTLRVTSRNIPQHLVIWLIQKNLLLGLVNTTVRLKL